MRLQFSTAGQIHFGNGILWEYIPIIAAMGKRILCVSGGYVMEAPAVVDRLQELGCETQSFLVDGEPSLHLIADGVDRSRRFQPDAILAIGGGSVMDTGKAVSGLTANPGDPINYLEVVGAGEQLKNAGPAVIAVPTTAGTGAEVTRNAVIGVPSRRVKVSLRSPYLLARVAIVDPTLTYHLPPAITAHSGMDALVQLIEAYLSIRSNELTDLFCREGIERASHSLQIAYRDGNNPLAREDMSYASLLGGLALANAGLGAVHGFAGPIGGMYQASHGAICARLLSPVIRKNYAALLAMDPGLQAISRYREIASLILGLDATVEKLADWIDDLCEEMKIPHLRDLGVLKKEFQAIIDQSAVASSMKANPVVLDREEMQQILIDAW